MRSLSTASRTLAAIICCHAARGEEPIRVAIRTASEDPDDSGWQFLCASAQKELPEEAQVWLLSEVLEREPSLANWMEFPVGTRLERATATSSWTQVK